MYSVAVTQRVSLSDLNIRFPLRHAAGVLTKSIFSTNIFGRVMAKFQGLLASPKVLAKALIGPARSRRQ
jgi:hypothetical protein